MKRRVLSFILILTLCLNLCPVWALAADAGTDDGLCPHHLAHTDACGYVPPAVGQECTHVHDEDCYKTETSCVHEHTAECYPESDGDTEAGEPTLCTHECTQDSGCVKKTLSCPHIHDDSCGYAAGNPGEPCTFECKICSIEDLLDKLPGSITEDNSEQVQEQVSEIYALYDELTEDEQDQVDLSPCAALLEQVDGMETAVLSAGSTIDLTKDMTNSLEASSTHTLRLNGHNVLPPESSTYAIRILGTGVLTIEGRGTISSKGVGVEVQSGGSLSIAEPDLCINGSMYALDIASGAKVQLSAGKYHSKSAPVIHTADGDYAALLAPGCAYFDADNSNKPIPLTDVAKAMTVIVDQCKDHLGESVTHKKGTPTHTWPCLYCGTEETEGCTFTFAEDGTGTCSKCGSTLEIFVDEDDLANLVYDGTIVPENVNITVTLTDGSNEKLVKDTDYTVTYEIHKDAGEITVTVTGITFEGTFTNTYQVNRDHPVLEWDTTAKPVQVSVNYDGDPVGEGDLPSVKININASEDLHKFLQYSYKKQGDSDYTSGLPTNAGTYEVIVSLPEMDNFEAAVSDPITLTINPINPIVTPPVATQPVFNRAEQELVTAGKLCDVAVRDGIEIQFTTSENGPYSTTIPTGTDAGDAYRVWYQVVGTSNYTAVGPTEIEDVEILRKPITPVVELSEYKYLYDGGFKEPKVTVRDMDRLTVLLDSEYQVQYVNNQNVSTDAAPAKVIVTDKAGGNYELTQVEVKFKITSRTQEALSITQKPDVITYGDKFTLSTSGGSGSGDVTWEIITDDTDGSKPAVATVNKDSGQVTIIGHGSATVKATKSGESNYEDATASWTFTADKKPVTATVTADDKVYDGNATATVHATVDQGVLPGDEITITGLTGTFDNVNAGADKTVTVNKENAAITGQNSEHYDVSYSNAPVRATIHKAVAKITTEPVPATLTYNGTAQVLIGTGAVVDPADVPVEYALSETGPYSTDFPKATNAGTYTVWYRIQETNNYTGLAPESVDVTIAKKSAAPTITLSENTFTYDGTAKEPTVTLTEADGTTEIPANEYTVAYSNNTDVGTATVTVTAKADGNYEFTPDTTVTKDFTINKVQAQVLTAPEAAGDPLIFSNRDQKLVTAGTGSGGTMVYSKDNKNFDGQIPTGITAAEYTIYYKVQGDANHSDSAIGSVKVTIAPKTVKDPTIELFDENDVSLVSYTYDGSAKEPKAVVKDGSDVIGGTEYNVIYSDNINAGKATVNITDKPSGNYIVSGSATFVIGKADIVFNPEPKEANLTYNGKPQELLVPGKTSGGTVLYALNSATSTYGDAIPTATEAGSYTVYYKVVGDTNHNDFAVKSVPVTIKRKSLSTVNIELTPNSFEYDGTVKMPAVAVKDGKTVLPEEEYTWTCDNTSPKNQGTYTITISDAVGGNYDLNGVTTKTATFSIGKTAQKELVIEDKPDATIYGDTFTLTTSGGSSNSAVTWEATGPATVGTTGEVEITGVGEVTITATNHGDDNYEPVSAQWTFTAAPKPVTASITVASRAYDGTTAATVASAGITTLNSDTVTIDPASITAAFDSPSAETGKTVTLDTSKVQVIGDDAAKYEISYPDTVTADITKATTTLTTAPAGIASLEYTGQPQALVTAGETNVGFLVYSLNGTDFSPEIPTGTNAGTYNVYYKVDGTSDYTEVAVNATPISVNIAPKAITPTVTLLPVSFVYNGTKQEPVIMVKDGDTVIDQNQYEVTWDKDLTSVGTHTATIKNVENGNYSFTVTDKVEIIPAVQNALEITGKPDHVYYGDTITTLGTAGGTGNGTVKWSITAGATIEDTGRLTVKDTGSITVTAVRTVPNYGDVSADWTFTVEPKPVTAKVTITDKVYDGTNRIADADITAAVKADDLVDSTDNFTISRLTGTYDDVNAGTNKTVTLDATNATKEDGNGKYIVSYPATAKGNITPKPVTVTVTLSGDYLNKNDDGTYYYEYDGTEKKPTVTVTTDDGATLAPSDYDVNYSNNKNVTNDTTKATVIVTKKVGGNYTFLDQTVNFEIRKADATLTLPPQPNNLTYTGQPQALVSAGTATGGHIEYSEDGSAYSEDIPQGTKAGTYTVYYKVVGDSNHSDGVTRQVSVTIQPKEVISPKITVDGTYTYNGSAQEPTVTVEDGTTTIDATEYTLSYRDNINAGTATVIVTNANGGNYIVNGTATFVIAKASATVTTVPTPQTLSYNGTAQELVTAGSASGGTMVYSLVEDGEYSTAIPTGKTVGSYTVYYKVQGDSNHEDSTAASVTAKIVQNNVANPIIQVTPDTVTYNGKEQEPRVSVKDDKGLAIDSSEYTVTHTGDLTNVGKYTLTITGVTGGNYTFDTTDGKNTAKFEILPADQTPLTITGTRERVYYGDTIQLGTTGGSGTVTWEVDDSSNSIASINDSNGLLEIKGVGPVTVTATSTAPGYTDQTATWAFHADKKPVTADVTAAAKIYDGVTPATTTVTATLQSSDLVDGDKVQATLSGTFEDPNVGKDKKVNVDSTAPDFTGSTGQENYNITYPAATTASILKADIANTDVTAPTAATGLTYTGQPQALVTAGSVTKGGIMEYSLDGKTYSVSLPTGTDAGQYDVWYRVKGDGNHNDTAAKQLIGQVTIAPQEVTNPIIEFTPSGASYDGREHKPSVTVKDAHNRVIPDSEYTVTYGGTDWTTAGGHEVTITDKNGGNYTITEEKKTFNILVAGQSPLSITNKPGKVQYGDSFTLSAVGGSITGAVTWASSATDVASIDDNGVVTVHKAGSVTITAKKLADGNYSEVSDTWSFNAEKKPVTPIVTARDKEYDQTNKAELDITWKDGDLLNSDTIDLKDILTGQFEDTNVGTNKKVTIIGTSPVDERYTITIPRSTTAAITPKAASVTGSTNPTLTYTGSAQGLISGITAENGTLAYSQDGSYYTLTVPEEKNAGTYPVWYKAQASGNYKDSPAVRVNVTIKPKEVTSPGIELSPETFEYDGTPKKPDVVVKDGSTVIPSSEYTVSYSRNTAVGTATVTITDVDGGNYIVSGSKDFTIQAGAPRLTAEPQPRNLTYNGFAQALVTAGSAVNGHVEYCITVDGDYSTTIPRKTDAGIYEVWYKVVGDNNTETAPDSVIVEIMPKTVVPVVTVDLTSDPLPYTGSSLTPLVTVVAEGKTLTSGVDYTTAYRNNTNVGTATVTVQSVSGSNYQFSATATFEIAKSQAEFKVKPEAKTGLVYTGEPQELFDAGYSLDGIVLYSQDAVAYSADIPTGTNVRTYTFYAKVKGDSKHEDSDPIIIRAQIGTNVVSTPTVILSQNSFNYTGNAHTPTVTVSDGSGNVIPASEYTVTYSNNVNVGTATVTVTSKGNNYSFTATKTFQIVGADQSLLEITGKKDTVYYGDTLTLGTTGGSGSGAVTWASSDSAIAEVGETTGAVTIKKPGSVTITATKPASGSYGPATATWTFIAQPKPITAVVTAANKTYDGNNTATLSVTLPGLLTGDTATGVTATGHFADASVGTNKPVIIESLTVPDSISAKYAITHPDITTASITPAAATVDTAPAANTGLAYTGTPQALVSAGTANGGNLAYSLDGMNYSFNVPTGTDAKTYTVWYKVVASDENHKDSAVTKLGNVTISANTDTPTVLCTPATFQYDGTEKTPTVVVRDSAQRVIPESEYTVTFGPDKRIAVGKYSVTVTDNPGGNYEFTSSVTATDAFEIVSASQNPLSIVTDKATDVYYGDTFRLSAMGGSGSGAIQWKIPESSVATINANGVVTVTGTGGFTVEAYREAADGYNKSNTDRVPFEAHQKPITPVVTAVDKPYDGNTTAALKAVWPSGALVGNDKIDLTVNGAFATADVGTNKRVDITSHTATGTNADKYTITWPESTTASIYKVDAKLKKAPTALNPTYNGSERELIAAGETENDIGKIVYSLSQNGEYSETIPTAITAGKYIVWYKVPDSVNYTGIPAASIDVIIQSSGSTNNASMRTTVQNGTANTVLNAAAGRKLVNEAAAAQSDSIVIKPEITSDVTKAQVSIPASTVSQIKNETNAALTVSAPIADVTIPNAALDTLSSAGGTVNVVTEQVDQAVVLTLTADGKSVESVPGGVTLTVPAEDAGPGTVAVLVHEDGTRETVRKSVAEDGKVNIPLDGSATVEIVDNSKNFDDVPDTSWASDAVDFASAHELFNGTSETTFSPDQPMSRGMLATVLYNLEGCPAQEQASGFSDVSSDAWYADGVAWAAENGIADGYGDGQFGPEESITREQFVVMLWKYAGSPQANQQTLAFEDADQVSDYAQEALCWAVESGILNGVGEGQLAPGGTATRAQAAQMLKRFMENG